MNCTIWRAKDGQWMLLGASMLEGGYISIAGVWGIARREKSKDITPAFEDETSGICYYMTEKGKNWPLFLRLCPELKKFQFWDENRTRSGTFKQEWYLYESNLLYSPFLEQIRALEGAGLKDVDVLDNEEIAIFPPEYWGTTYTFGTLVLSLPMPKHLQWDFKELCEKENRHEQ